MKTKTELEYDLSEIQRKAFKIVENPLYKVDDKGLPLHYSEYIRLNEQLALLSKAARKIKQQLENSTPL